MRSLYFFALWICLCTVLGCGFSAKSSAETDGRSEGTSYHLEQNRVSMEEARNKLSAIEKDIQLFPYESIYVGYHNESIVKQSKPVRAASMIKVYILGYLFEEIEAGHIDLGETIELEESDKVGGAGVLSGYAVGTKLTVDELAKLMITVSDNSATNILIHRLGMGSINQYVLKNGFIDTKLQRYMMDLEAIRQGRENYTSAKDLGNWFMNLLEGKGMSNSSREKMLMYLLGQTDTETFNEALSNRLIAHKTGELAGVYHDGGIIFQSQDYKKGEAYILITLSDSYELRESEVYHFKNIAKYIDSRIFER